jgi:peptide/nickel transport system permease protein
MISSVLSQFYYSFLTLFGVVTIIFFLFNVLPGDPAQMMVDQQEDSLQMEQIKKKNTDLIYPFQLNTYFI